MLAGPEQSIAYKSSFAPSSSPRMDYTVDFVTTGTHYVWLRGWGANGGADSCHVGLNNAQVTTATSIGWDNDEQWSWENECWYTGSSAAATITIPSTGVHTINVWMREDGFILDKIILTTNSSYNPLGTGDQNVLIEGLNPVVVEGLTSFLIEGLQ